MSLEDASISSLLEQVLQQLLDVNHRLGVNCLLWLDDADS